MNTKLLFAVENRHTEDSGTPPLIDTSISGRYYGYYENEHGEQALFVYDRQTQTGTLWMGDAGWEHPVKVVDGLAPELILSREEETWLQACWNAATAFEGK